ncbi:MAG: hypothetical protein HGA38_04915 [Candidatus Moranbacteria bacterium]|nr:hypothetical protein [Candidatus Moranbacteria bacterium]
MERNPILKPNIDKVKKFLNDTGFPFEMYASKTLRELGYEVKPNQFFYDIEGEKVREIDLVASKTIDGVEIVIVAECKQSNKEAWIFVAPEENSRKALKYIKHHPSVDFDSLRKCFSGVHLFSKSLPLATSCISYDFLNNKQAQSTAIIDAMNKAVKGTLDIISDRQYLYGSEKKSLFFSVVLFSGDTFLATFDDKLHVKKVNHILYRETFDSEVYEDKTPIQNNVFSMAGIGVSETEDNWEQRRKKEKIINIQKNYSLYKPAFVVDVVNEKSIEQYIKLLEEGVKSIMTEDWIPTEDEG